MLWQVFMLTQPPEQKLTPNLMAVTKDTVISFDLRSHQSGVEDIHPITLALLKADFANVISFAERYLN